MRARILIVVMVLGAIVPAAPVRADQVDPAAQQELRASARQHFEQGLRLLDERRWDAALAEFLRSRELFATRAATVNAAVALRELGRLPEALELLDSLLKEFRDLPADERARVEREISALEGRTGFVRVQASEPGAAVSIAGRDHGVTPLPGPVRVAVGSHVVRLAKRGYIQFERRVSVAGRQEQVVVANLVPLTRSGSLRVAERQGRAAEVLVDGSVVGKAPWQGALAPGNHSVALRAAGALGSEPAHAAVRADESTVLTLELVPLRAELRVDPIPATALIAIDGVTVGRGAWQGRLAAREHVIETSADGFLTRAHRITLADGESRTLRVELDRDPDSMIGTEVNPPGFFVTGMLGASFTPTLGSQMADSCAANCDEAPAFGGLVVADLGYHLGSGAGLGLEIGAFRVTQTLHGVRNVTLSASADEPANVDDDLLVNAYFAGVFGELHRGTTLTWRATLALGATVIVVRDTERSGRIGSAPIQPIESDAERALYGHATVGMGLGYRLDRHWEIGAELRSTVLLALSNRPEWNDAISGSAGSAVTFDDEALLGSVMFLPHVVLGIRHEFH